MTTATVTPAPREIRSWVPSPRVLHAVNPFVAALLRSPLHGLISKQVLLLTYTGRKTGKPHTIPVGYRREGDTLTILSTRRWWKNLRGGTPVVVRLRGRRQTARAEGTGERDAVLAAVEHLVAGHGLADTGRLTGLGLDVTPPPTRDELARALRGHALIRLTLDGGAGRGGV
ncbi:MAG TPA: nitroreductase/quinone reductase family protein [Thermomicrobiales bacterium]|nr:nitroreductase/quinone reductase family protein [Thermomicrobiales bacterium]